MIGAGACVGLICSLWAVGLSHAVYGQVRSENEPAPQSADMRISPEYLQANADPQAQTREAVGPFEWSANDKQLIVKPALLVILENSAWSFQVRLSSVPSGDVTVVVSVPTRLDGKLIPSEASLTFTASNFDQFQEVSVRALPGSDTEDKEEVLTLEASGGGYNRVEASVPIYVDQDVCVRPARPHWRSVREGTSCTVYYNCGFHGLGLGDYMYLFHVNGSATPGVDLIVNGLNTLEVTEFLSGSGGHVWGRAHTRDQLVAPTDGIPEGDETLGCFCIRASRPPPPQWKGHQILILDADGWAVGDTAAAESSDEMTFLLKFPMPVARDLTVKYQTEDGSATAGDDYDSQTGEVTVQKGGTSAEIPVPIISDNIAEGVEEFKLVTWSDQFQGIGSLKATGRILEGPPRIQLRENPLEVEEGSSATYQARLTIEPSDEVTVAISWYTGTDVSLVEPTSLTFMPSDFGWKDVKVSTAIDEDSNPDKATLTHTAGGALEYAGVTADLEVTILDRYAVELKVAPTVLALKERGSDPDNKAGFEVSLGSPPVGGEVKVAISVADALQNKVSLSEAGPLTFGTSSWDKAQTITVTALADADAADESGTVDLTASGAGYGGQQGSVTVTVEDDEVLELIVSPKKLSLTEDADPGKEKSFEVRLGAAPAVPEVNVAVIVSTDLSGKATVGPGNLVYTSSNWSVDQTVTVTALADADVTDESGTMILIATGGASFDRKTESVAVDVKDDDVRGLRVSPKTLALKEDATHPDHTMDIRVRLQSAPVGGNVTVSASASASLDGKVSFSAALTFTSTDWNVEQSITVTAEDDADAVDESGTVDLTASGAGYGGQSGSVTVAISDDDTPALNISASTLNVDEGGSATYSVSLTTEPSVEVSVAITSDNPEVTLDRNALSFGVDDWNQSQRITVSAREDDDALPDKALLAHEASGGEYVSVSGTVAVNVIENDTPALKFSAPTLNVDEGGSAAYSVSLTTEPSAQVSVAIASDNADVTLDKKALSFGVDDWNQSQRITVSAREDDDALPDKALLAHEASGGEYGSVSGTVAVNVIENDTPALKFSAPTLNVDEGGSVTYTVSLTTEPSVKVSVAITSDNADVTLGKKVLSFGVGDWNQPQLITVSAREDDDASPDKAILAHQASGGEYGAESGTVAVNVIENDTPALKFSSPVLNVDEGGSATYTVSLATEPSAQVSVAITSDNPEVTLDRKALSFGVDDWNQSQRITVSAREDDDALPDNALLAHEASGGEYGSVSGTVAVNVIENGVPALNISDLTLNVDEGGSATYTVWLATEPSGRVSVAITSDNPEVTLDRNALSFGVGDWNQPQRIRVSAREDDDALPDKALLAHKASGGGYGAVSGTVGATVIENDTPGLQITPPAIAVVEGERGTY